MKVQVLLFLLTISLMQCKKKTDYVLEMEARDILYNQECSSFNTESDSPNQFIITILLKDTIVGYDGFGINSFVLTNENQDKQMEASCEFKDGNDRINCKLNSPLEGDENEKFHVVLPNKKPANFMCYIKGDTERKNSYPCILEYFSIDKEVTYNPDAILLSPDILEEQSVDLSDPSANFVVDFTSPLDEDDLPPVFLGNSEADCKVPEGKEVNYILCYPTKNDYNIREDSEFFPVSIINACGNVELPGITVELYNSVQQEKAAKKAQLMIAKLNENSSYIKISALMFTILALILM